MTSKSEPTISVVIPVLNEEKLLPAALQALKELAVEEIIFVDGGSSDASRRLIQAYGYRCLESRAGRARQMNTGAKASLGDIILYLHIDTMVTSCNILNIRKAYNQGFLSGRFDIRFTYTSLTYCFISYFMNMRSRLTKISTGDQALFVRRDVFEEVGGYPDIPLMEDIALAKKLKRLGRVACLRDTVVTSSRRWQRHGVLRTVLQMWSFRLLYWLGVSAHSLAEMYRDVR